ncbi:[protein-PII] uridylyltransferase family protein [Mycolicibacter minnesotensis]
MCLDPRGRRSSADELAATRAAFLRAASTRWDSDALRKGWLHLHESWLIARAKEIGVVAGSGFAIVATGSFGRRELLPYSDLDLMLVHDAMPAGSVARVADDLWYPMWDANVRLDHAVRTVPEALAVASSDIVVGLAMLDARHIAGDVRLSARLIGSARKQWRCDIAARYQQLVEATHARWHRSGDIADTAEPDVKCGRGGLRDAQLLDALAVAQWPDSAPGYRPSDHRGLPRGAYRTLLDIRTELHRVSVYRNDLVLRQYANYISRAIGVTDTFDLSAAMADAARSVSSCVDAVLGAGAAASRRRGMPALRS